MLTEAQLASLPPLMERGFTVVPDFFTQAELDVARRDFTKTAARPKNPITYELESHALFASDEYRPLRARVEELMAAVRAHTEYKPDLIPVRVGTYVRRSSPELSLHCDVGAEFHSNGTQNCVKCWVPIVKADPRVAGMTFVRRDLLKAREPELWAKLQDHGAVHVDLAKNEIAMLFTPQEVELHYPKTPIGELLDTPDAKEGDIILFRSDTVHASQVRQPALEDGRPERVAWTFAIKWSKQAMYRKDLYTNPLKRGFMGRIFTSAMLATFWERGADQITYEDFNRFEARCRRKELKPLAILGLAYLLDPIFNVRERSRPLGKGSPRRKE